MWDYYHEAQRRYEAAVADWRQQAGLLIAVHQRGAGIGNIADLCLAGSERDHGCSNAEKRHGY